VHSFVDFHVDVACNTNASVVCGIKITGSLLNYSIECATNKTLDSHSPSRSRPKLAKNI